ncbi:MAG TPA: peptidase, partial [Rhodanobacteraceae bacterium]|nr:peptidase [Rhodanobacteraceae bacterium]
MHHHVRLKLLVAALGMTAFTAAGAATTQRLNAEPLAAAPATQLAASLGLGTSSQLEARFSQPTRHGTTTVRMQQTWHGVPVYGRTVAVEIDANGAAIRASGAVERGLDVDLVSAVPKLDGDAAQGLLRVQQQDFLWVPGVGVSNKQSTLYVYPEQQSGTARLVYLTSYLVHRGDQVSRPTALIDANSGEVIKQWDGLAHADFDANGPGGNQKTGEYYWGQNGLPALKATTTDGGSTCSLSNSDVKTYDLNHASSGSGTLVSFNCPTHSGDSINGAYSPANDAHHFGQVIHDMYNAWFGAPPLNQTLIMKVHLKNNYENAYWDGTAMNFGDGGSSMYPLVSLDVTGHEISHGFTEQHSNLEYTGQSGGMNES